MNLNYYVSCSPFRLHHLINLIQKKFRRGTNIEFFIEKKTFLFTPFLLQTSF